MHDWERKLADEDAPVYPIGVVAELLDTSVQVIRRYDDAAVVEPERSSGGHRRYSRRHIARLAHILQLAEEGIPLAGIKRILALEAELERAKREAKDEDLTDES